LKKKLGILGNGKVIKMAGKER